jgi:hypothetical protein
VIGTEVARHDAGGDVPLAEAFDLPAGTHAQAAGIQEKGHHHLGLEGGLADAVGAIGGMERSQVELVDGVEEEVVLLRQMAAYLGDHRALRV